jgi:neutral ceramidase
MILCGTASADITPAAGYPLAGFAARKEKSKGIHDPLKAKALVIEAGETVAVVTADLVSFPNAMVREIRAKVSAMTGIPQEAVMLSSSHTHSGPSLDDNYGGQGTAPKHYWNTLVDAIAGAVYAAWLDRRVSRVGFTSGPVEGIGVNRRTPDGKPVDPQTTVMVIEQLETGKKTVFINYTCHAVVLGPDNLQISADYPGFAMRILEKLLGEGSTVMFSNGAAGDVNTGHSADLSALGYPIPGRTFERAERLGSILAGAVFSLMQKVSWEEQLEVRSLQSLMKLPTKPLPPVQEAERELENSRKVLGAKREEGLDEEELIPFRVKAFYAELLLYRIRERKDEVREPFLEFEIQGIRIGGLLLLAVPVELFVSIGLNVKTRSPFPLTAIVGYANGHLGYLPCRETYAEGGYEAVSTRLSDEGADLVQAAMIEVSEKLASDL